MKLKVLLMAGVIGFSGQAYAATDTSCNPFARGESCQGAWGSKSVASSHSAIYRASSERGGAASAAGGQSQGVGQMLSQLIRSSRSQAIVIDGPVLSEEDTDVVIIGNGGGDSVSEVPVPAAGFLLLAGLGGLVALRRKKS